MKYNLLSAFLTILLLTGAPVRAQTNYYARALLTGAHDVTVAQSATGPDGLTVMCGNYSRTLTLGTTTFTGATPQSPAGFVGKMASGNQWRWALPISSSTAAAARTVGADAAGNTYVAGTITSNTLFGNTALVPSGSQDVFIAKISPAGQWLWAQQIGATTAEPCAVAGLAVTARGNVVVTGTFRGRAYFGPIALTSQHQPVPPYDPEDDIYVAGLDAAGNWRWARHAGGVGPDTATGLALDQQENAYVTGYAQAGAQFDSLTFGSPTGGLFVAKYDEVGAVQWTTAADSAAGQTLTSTAVGTDAAGDIYLTGYFSGAAAFGPYPLTSAGAADVFVASLSPQGAWRWAQRAGGPDDDRATALATGLGGFGTSLTVVGSFRQTVPFGGSPLTSRGADDVFVAFVDPATGYWLNTWALGGASRESAVSVHGSRGQLLVSGNFDYYSPLSYGTGQTPNPAARNGYLVELFLMPPTATAADLEAAALQLWPNPARETAWVRLPAAAIDRPLEVLDITGRVVQMTTVAANDTETRLPLTGLAPGVYVVRCGEETARLMVQ